jgi:hypothetical protein
MAPTTRLAPRRRFQRRECSSPHRHDHREVHFSKTPQTIGILESVTTPDGRVTDISAGNPND